MPHVRALGLVACLFLVSPCARAEDAPPAPPPPSNDTVAVDLEKPDLLVVSQSFSSLFRDVLQVPLLRDLLTEDFAFYYESRNEGTLSLAGAAKRIAFEHELSGFDRLVRFVLDSPVEAAFWKGYDGRLSQFVIAMDRSLLKIALEGLARAAASDEQLKALPDRTLPDGDKAKVFLVQLGGKKAYLAIGSTKLFLFSKEAMPLPGLGQKRWSEIVGSYFGAKKEVGFFSKLIGKAMGKKEAEGGAANAPKDAKHSLQLSASFLSFGYSALFPSLRAVSFRYAGAWSTAVLVDGDAAKEASAQPPWAFAPKGPSLCVSLPFSKAAAAGYLKRLEAKTADTLRLAVDELDTAAAACWYAESKYYSPLLLVGRKPGGKLKPEQWGAAFNAVVGANEAKKKRLEKVGAKSEGGVSVFTKDVGSRYGVLPAGKSESKALLGSKKFFPVTLVVAERALAFSPDPALARAAADTIARRAPSLKETVAGDPSVLASPASLAKLGRTAVLDSLPASQESLFRGSVAAYLLPSLDKMNKHPDYAATLPWAGGGLRWEAVEWRAWR